MAASETLWPAAVSERSADLVHGQPQSAVVLGAFGTALYLHLPIDGEGGDATVLPVVTPGGLRLPTALVAAAPLPIVGWGVQPGDEVVVGDGEVRLPRATIRVVRTWRPVQVRPATPRSSLSSLAPLLAGIPLTWRGKARSLTQCLLHDRPTGSPAAETLASRVAELVGAGPGLTPSGDDVLCGILLGLRLAAPDPEPLVHTLWGAVRPRLGSTTSLSAALLTEAAQGYAASPVVHLTRALGDAELSVVAEAVREVLAIGHSSGADLLGGLAGCLEAIDTPLAASPRSLP